MEMDVNWTALNLHTYQILFHHAVVHFFGISMAVVVFHVKIMLWTAVKMENKFMKKFIATLS